MHAKGRVYGAVQKRRGSAQASPAGYPHADVQDRQDPAPGLTHKRRTDQGIHWHPQNLQRTESGEGHYNGQALQPGQCVRAAVGFHGQRQTRNPPGAGRRRGERVRGDRYDQLRIVRVHGDRVVGVPARFRSSATGVLLCAVRGIAEITVGDCAIRQSEEVDQLQPWGHEHCSVFPGAEAAAGSAYQGVRRGVARDIGSVHGRG